MNLCVKKQINKICDSLIRGCFMPYRMRKNNIIIKIKDTVSHKSEYTPHISAKILVYLLKGQYYTNETWIYFRVVNVQLV